MSAWLAVALRDVWPWLSLDLLAVPLVAMGYRRGRRGSPRAWAWMAASNCVLLATGLLSIVSGSRHLGLLVTIWLIYAGARNYRALRAGEATPVILPRRGGGWNVYLQGRHLAAIPDDRLADPTSTPAEAPA